MMENGDYGILVRKAGAISTGSMISNSGPKQRPAGGDFQRHAEFENVLPHFRLFGPARVQRAVGVAPGRRVGVARLHRLVKRCDELLQFRQPGVERLELGAENREVGQNPHHIGARLRHPRHVFVKQLLARRRTKGDLALVAIEERQIDGHAEAAHVHIACVAPFPKLRPILGNCAFTAARNDASALW